ncbi:hypothetical protein JAAARDRAFT_147605 [Jaapia argillacea MUCL 33604]|uniref:Phenylacetyl-CoA ligase n=1 Tax=Jaapia argillacea MUCL 33604 TaxID=933084 RepID=A0A067QB44_9AGAM|nr:hypothetical protein JAAARDRAFT_147605 [Jaapia argillacea MUCL 33604]
MVEIRGVGGPLPRIPDDLTLAQFMLDSHTPIKPVRKEGIPWLIDDETGRRVGFEELRMRTFGLANALKLKYNIGEDDVVCIYSSNHVDYPVAIWATHRLGAIVSGANPSYTAPELAYQLELTKSSVILVHPGSLPTALKAASLAKIPTNRIILFDPLPQSGLPTLDQLINEGLSNEASFVERRLKPGEGKKKLAFLSFSSGTTGKPKAVAIPHYSPIANVIQMAVQQKVNEDDKPWDGRRFRPGDVSSGVLPFYHIYGLVVNLHLMLLSGLTVVVTAKFNFEEFLKSIQRYKITHVWAVPPHVVLLCKHPSVKNYDLSSVRYLMAGAAPLSAELTTQLTKVLRNSDLGQGYGMTETCTVVTMYPTAQKIGTLGSAGQLIPGCVARVVKEDGSIAKIGEIGELVVRSPSNALGYFLNEEATRETFVDGWVRTGDEVYFNENAELFVVDRLKELLKVRGFQVAPAELEGHLMDHPDIADCCVIGIPDEFSGDLPLAFVVLDNKAAQRVAKDPTEADKIKASIIKYVADHKIKYKQLAGGVEFIGSIPRNPSGKLLRRLLRDQAKESRASEGGKAKAKL